MIVLALYLRTPNYKSDPWFVLQRTLEMFSVTRALRPSMRSVPGVLLSSWFLSRFTDCWLGPKLTVHKSAGHSKKESWSWLVADNIYIHIYIYIHSLVLLDQDVAASVSKYGLRTRKAASHLPSQGWKNVGGGVSASQTKIFSKPQGLADYF